MNVPTIPWMAKSEINMITKYLSPNKKMIEYGCGGSTLFFPKYVCEYHSIESSVEWSNRVKSRCGNNTTIHCIPVNVSSNNEQRSVSHWNQLYKVSLYFAYKEYIEHFSKICEDVDVVLIDGRARPQCARYIYDYISPRCIVFIHDWNRQYYKTVLHKYDIIEEDITNTQGIVALAKLT